MRISAKLTLAACLLVGSYSPPSVANDKLPGYGNGEELSEGCQLYLTQGERKLDAVEADKVGRCMSYVAGVMDSFSFRPMVLGGFEPTTCIPDGVTVDAATEVVARYFESHPENVSKLPAYVLVAYALEKEYPCLVDAWKATNSGN